MKFHEIVNLFPQMDEESLNKLADSIRKNGLRDPIHTYEGKIIDGRNRYLACQQCGVEPRFVEWEEEESLTAFVIDKNAERRHLDAGQRAMLAKDAMPWFEKEAKERRDKQANINLPKPPTRGKVSASGGKMQPSKPEAIPDSAKGKARDKAAKAFKTNPNYIRDSKKLEEEAPDLEAEVRAGTKKLPAAMRELEARKTLVFSAAYEKADYAKWSWNPVTGCKGDCEYCPVRATAEELLPEKFEPAIHPEGLAAPANTQIPTARLSEPGIHNVIVCEMGDLFGPWVPQEWLDQVLDAVRANPRWTYIFRTKNPTRYIGIDWPANCWLGAVVSTQEEVKAALEALVQIHPKPSVRFLACDPLLEFVTLGPHPPIDWLIIGARHKTADLPEFQPEWEGLGALLGETLLDAKIPVYIKHDVQIMIRSYPGSEPTDKEGT